MPKNQVSFTAISLTSILSDKEMANIVKSDIFKDGKDNDYSYEKSELLLKFISLALEKFQNEKDNTMIKCFEWVKKEIQIRLGISQKTFILEKAEKAKVVKPEDEMKFNWMKEYSTMYKDNAFYENLGKNILKYAFKKYISFLAVRRKMKASGEEVGDIFSFSKLFKEKNSKLIEANIDDNNKIIESDKFNIFQYEKRVGKNKILKVISTYAISQTKLFYLIQESKFENFVNEITRGYHRENPYHTDLHAADMVQSIFLYNKRAKFKTTIMVDDFDLLSLFISAIVHDYGHPGFNNNYLITIMDDLAITYNDISVLENYHVSSAFKIMKEKPECNILDCFTGSDYKMLRKTIITCVLGTDMTFHGKTLQTFSLRLKTFGIEKGNNIDKLFKDLDSGGLYNLKVEFLSLIIHTADISNPSKPLEIYLDWANRCVSEFFNQGDLEKKRGLPVSFGCDRSTVSLPQSQLGFINFIVEPHFKLFTEYFPQLDFTTQNITINKAYFTRIIEDEKKNKEESKNSENNKK